MSDILFGSCLLLISIAVAYPSVLTKTKWSGREFTGARFRIALTYNIFFAYCHIQFLNTGVATFTDIESPPSLQYFSILFVFIHASSLPDRHERLPWFKRKSSLLQKTLNSYPNHSATKADSFFYWLTIVTLFTAALLLHAAIISFAAIWIIENFIVINPNSNRKIWLITFAIIAPPCFYGIYRHHKKHGRIF